MGKSRAPGGGRKPKLTGEQVQALRDLALSRPLLSLGELTRAFCEAQAVRLSAGAVRGYLVQAGVARSRPASTAEGDKEVAAEPSPFGYTAVHRDQGASERYPHGLTDIEWSMVADLFEQHGPGRPSTHTRRAIVDACCYVIRSGCPWRMLPRDMPPWQTVYAQFRRWSAQGLFEAMYDRLRVLWREREGRSAQPTATIIDAQSVKTSAQGGAKGYDAGKKVKGRKRHLATDTLGLILVVLITAASVQDRDAAEPLIAAAKAKVPTLVKGFADGGYAGRHLDRIREEHNVDIEIVRHPNNRNVGRWHDAQLSLELPEPTSTAGFQILQRRWVIERTNSWTDGCRRLARDNDRRLDVSTSWIWFAHARILLRRLAFAPNETAA